MDRDWFVSFGRNLRLSCEKVRRFASASLGGRAAREVLPGLKMLAHDLPNIGAGVVNEDLPVVADEWVWHIQSASSPVHENWVSRVGRPPDEVIASGHTPSKFIAIDTVAFPIVRCCLVEEIVCEKPVRLTLRHDPRETYAFGLPARLSGSEDLLARAQRKQRRPFAILDREHLARAWLLRAVEDVEETIVEKHTGGRSDLIGKQAAHLGPGEAIV